VTTVLIDRSSSDDEQANDMNSFKIDDLGGSLDRKAIGFMARVAESAERYDDMCQFMKRLVETRSDLTVEERNLLSVAYKNVVGARRSSWRTLTTSLSNEDDEKNLNFLRTYKSSIEAELEGVCQEVLALLKNYLVPHAKSNTSDVESQVFYLKMGGDYFRYLAEFRSASGYPEQARQYYQEALEIATDPLHEKILPPTHPIRLGLALNYSVCFYEILEDPQKACSLAKNAFDEAVSKLDGLDEAQYKDSTLIMQLLRDNLTLWTQENDD